MGLRGDWPDCAGNFRLAAFAGQPQEHRMAAPSRSVRPKVGRPCCQTFCTRPIPNHHATLAYTKSSPLCGWFACSLRRRQPYRTNRFDAPAGLGRSGRADVHRLFGAGHLVGPTRFALSQRVHPTLAFAAVLNTPAPDAIGCPPVRLLNRVRLKPLTIVLALSMSIRSRARSVSQRTGGSCGCHSLGLEPGNLAQTSLQRCMAGIKRSDGFSNSSPSSSIATCVHTARHSVATRSLCSR